MHLLQDPQAFRKARHSLGLSAQGLSNALHLGTGGGRTIRRWEAAERDIPGPAAIAVAMWLDPACPAHLRPIQSSRAFSTQRFE
jgi:hypothetical protein